MELGRKGRQLTPNEQKDPLSPKVGYGWGWFILLGLIGYGLQRALSTRTVNSEVQGAIKLSLYFLIPTIGVFIYFKIRKKNIKKKMIYKSYWPDSFLSGMIAYIISLLVFFIIGVILTIFRLFPGS